MQSGKGKMAYWLLEFAPEKPYFVDNLMGWTGMTDMPQEIKLRFPTQAAAIAYAKAQRIDYELFEPHARHQVAKAYADNFKFSKING